MLSTTPHFYLVDASLTDTINVCAACPAATTGVLTATTGVLIGSAAELFHLGVEHLGTA